MRKLLITSILGIQVRGWKCLVSTFSLIIMCVSTDDMDWNVGGGATRGAGDWTRPARQPVASHRRQLGNGMIRSRAQYHTVYVECGSEITKELLRIQCQSVIIF